MEAVVDSLATEMNGTFIAPHKKYNNYGVSQISYFLEIILEEGVTVPNATEMCMVPRTNFSTSLIREMELLFPVTE